MSDETLGFYRASTLDASPLTFVRQAKPQVIGVHAADRQLKAERDAARADLAEALAFLREVRRLAEDDVAMMDDIASMGVLPYGGPEESSARVAAHLAHARLARIDALLARHPAPDRSPEDRP